MKHLLLIPLLALSLTSFAASKDTAMDKVKKDAGSSGAAKEAEDWKATKFNNDMLNEQVEGVAIDQASAGIVGSNLMFDCVETNLNGRKDDLCKSSPNHPECVGLNKALDNATACIDPVNPPEGTPCKKYGTTEYSMDEWIAFGTQYYTGMSECYATKTRIESTRVTTLDGADSLRMSSLTMIMSDVPVANGLDTATSAKRDSGTSSVSGEANQQELSVNPTGFKSLSDLDDGSVYLGYERGELLKGAAEGKAFYQVVTKSPFAENLKPKNLKILENGLMESNLVIDKARVAGRLPALGENEEQYANATRDDATSAVGKAEGTTGSSSWSAAKAAKAANEKAATTAAVPALTHHEEAKAAPAERKLMLHERIALLEAQAKAKLSGKGDGRSLASLGKSHLDSATDPSAAAKAGSAPGEGVTANAAAGIGGTDTSLFERVTLAYRKRGDAFKSLESAEGRELRTMEAPKIFREL